MSQYSMLKVKLQPKQSLTEMDILTIYKKIDSRCGVGDYEKIDKESIEFQTTFNYGLNKIVELIVELEKHIDYDEVVEVGEFNTESISNMDYELSVYVFRNKIIILRYETESVWGFRQDIYYINDLRGNEKEIVCKESKDGMIENLIKEFVNSY